MPQERGKKKLFWFLTIFTFVILIVCWHFFLKNFSQKRREREDDYFIKDLIEQKDFFKESFDKLLYNLKEMRFISSPTREAKEKLTNQEIERLKEKIFQHVNFQYLNQELINNEE